ncbi:hypothetical protein C9994_03275 [Marivirga lumbricoides]|uniref:DUF7379 domain-containing protein n=1 Tax=Marivirga lumbricoides TaxID=1046115 RepID=A0A2T4DUG9_9BACT|nr:hypothetical protein C9994_03275 [Marivirga lumbricoides]
MIFNLQTDPKLSNGTTHFIPLGNFKRLDQPQIQDIEAHLPFSKTEKIEKIWGTLGWKDDKPFHERGVVKFSESGQLTEAKGATLKQIEMLYDIYPEIPLHNHRVRERYIDLDDLDIDLPRNISLQEMKELRLDIFLENNEGAVVYLQHSEKDNYDEEEAFIEYLSPQPTDDLNRLDQRNRLTYHIPFQFQRNLRPNGIQETEGASYNVPVHYLELSDEAPEPVLDDSGTPVTLESTSFIVKILTFIRSARTPEEALKGFGSALAKQTQKTILKNQLDKLGRNKYSLLKFKPEVDIRNDSGQFMKVQVGSEIDTSARTLLLIHGTFKDTYGSYEDFITKKYADTDHNYLNFLIKKGHYDQILAFDHPYFWDTPEQNAEWLINGLFENVYFEPDKLDILGVSRGALVGMYMATNVVCMQHLRVRKVLTFSGGASGFMDSIAGISKWISVVKIGAPAPVQKLLIGLASIGLNYLEKNSGLAALKSGNPFLNNLYTTPLQHPVIFKAMVADWNRHVVTGKGWIDTSLKRALASGLDTVLKLFLGWQHDWVIGSAAQRKLPQGHNSFPEPSFEYSGRHGSYFLAGFPKVRVGNKWEEADIYHEITSFLK